MATSDNSSSDSSSSDSDVESTNTNPNSLTTYITDNYRESDFHYGIPVVYLSDNILRKWMKEENVRNELGNQFADDKVDSLVNFIVNEADKVFAITCLVFVDNKEKLNKAMRRFQKEKATTTKPCR
ncbi:hypothetical protein CEP52_009857 [Fusarium oligoseptatum]|uniref:Uncharacterized protein n=1 Tax=Fusarium oligoseptatum TaxID=2604345 RepID=A0A428TAY4_9HYPO|nr:hypothetical protein CEP52_009857 [Fusarium oligoseptatum]